LPPGVRSLGEGTSSQETAARGLWRIQEPLITNRPGGRLGHYVMGFGQDEAGEVYVLTSDSQGPTGETGRVYRLAQPGGD
jgi:hypothetical protein